MQIFKRIENLFIEKKEYLKFKIGLGFQILDNNLVIFSYVCISIV